MLIRGTLRYLRKRRSVVLEFTTEAQRTQGNEYERPPRIGADYADKNQG